MNVPNVQLLNLGNYTLLIFSPLASAVDTTIRTSHYLVDKQFKLGQNHTDKLERKGEQHLP